MTIPPNSDESVPFGVDELHRHITGLLENCRRGGGHTAEGVLNLVVSLLENTACAHADCPSLLLDHGPPREL